MEICAVPQVTHYRQVWFTDLVLLFILYSYDIDIARTVLRTRANVQSAADSVFLVRILVHYVYT